MFRKRLRSNIFLGQDHNAEIRFKYIRRSVKMAADLVLPAPNTPKAGQSVRPSIKPTTSAETSFAEHIESFGLPDYVTSKIGRLVGYIGAEKEQDQENMSRLIIDAKSSGIKDFSLVGGEDSRKSARNPTVQ